MSNGKEYSKGKEYLDDPAIETDETKRERVRGLVEYIRHECNLIESALLAENTRGVSDHFDVDTEMQDALDAAKGAWGIIRKGKWDRSPKVRRFNPINRPGVDESNAREARAKLDVREGCALLVDPAGKVIARQSGSFGVRSR